MNCPHCHQPITIDETWDFFECPHCKASLQKDGNTLSVLKEPEEMPVAQETPAPIKEENHPKNDLNHSPTPLENPSALAPEEVSSEELAHQVHNENNAPIEESQTPINEEVSEDAPEDRLENVSPTPQEPSQDMFQENVENQPDSLSPTESEGSNDSTPADIHSTADISKFGNTPITANNFVYELHIQNIDSEKTLSHIRNLLKLKELGLDATKLLNQIKDDQLMIPELSAVQTMYLVKKLSTTSVKLHWTQKSKLLS